MKEPGPKAQVFDRERFQALEGRPGPQHLPRLDRPFRTLFDLGLYQGLRHLAFAGGPFRASVLLLFLTAPSQLVAVVGSADLMR